MGSYCGSISSLRESLLCKHKQASSGVLPDCEGPMQIDTVELLMRSYQTGTRDRADEIPHCVTFYSDASSFKSVTSWTSMKMREEVRRKVHLVVM